MSVPTGSDASTGTDESAENRPDTDGESLRRHDESETVVETATDWLRHWKALAVAVVSLAVAGWAVIQPQASPKGYIPIFVGFAALAVGYVYLDEETRIRFASG